MRATATAAGASKASASTASPASSTSRRSAFASLASPLTYPNGNDADWRCRGVEASASGRSLVSTTRGTRPVRRRRRKELRVVSVAASTSSTSSSSTSSPPPEEREDQLPVPSGPSSAFNPAAVNVNANGGRFARIDVSFAVICLADELFARMAETDVSTSEGAEACAKSLAQVLPPPPPQDVAAFEAAEAAAKREERAAGSGDGSESPSPSRGMSAEVSSPPLPPRQTTPFLSKGRSPRGFSPGDVPHLSEREIVAVLRRLGRCGGPGAALAMRDFLEETRRGYVTRSLDVGRVLLHVAALNASSQAAEDVRARMEGDGIALDNECWNHLVCALAKGRDARGALAATDEAFAAGVVVDEVTYTALMTTLEKVARPVLESSSGDDVDESSSLSPLSSSSVVDGNRKNNSGIVFCPPADGGGAQPALDLWRRMKQYDEHGNEYTHRALVGALGRAREPEKALEVLLELYPPPPNDAGGDEKSSSSSSDQQQYRPVPTHVAGTLLGGAFRSGSARVALEAARMLADERRCSPPDAEQAGKAVGTVLRLAAERGPGGLAGGGGAGGGGRGEPSGVQHGWERRWNRRSMRDATLSSYDDERDSEREGSEGNDGSPSNADALPLHVGYSDPRATLPSKEDMELALDLYEIVRARYASDWHGNGGVIGSGSGSGSTLENKLASASAPQQPPAEAAQASAAASNSAAAAAAAAAAGISRQKSGRGGQGGAAAAAVASQAAAAATATAAVRKPVSYARLMTVAQRLGSADAVMRVVAWAEEDAAAAAAEASAESSSPPSPSTQVRLGARVAARGARVLLAARRYADAASVLAREGEARGDGCFGPQVLVLEAAAAAQGKGREVVLERDLRDVDAALASWTGSEFSSGGGTNNFDGNERRSSYSYNSPHGAGSEPRGVTGRSQRLAAAVGGGRMRQSQQREQQQQQQPQQRQEQREQQQPRRSPRTNNPRNANAATPSPPPPPPPTTQAPAVSAQDVERAASRLAAALRSGAVTRELGKERVASLRAASRTLRPGSVAREAASAAVDAAEAALASAPAK